MRKGPVDERHEALVSIDWQILGEKRLAELGRFVDGSL